MIAGQWARRLQRLLDRPAHRSDRSMISLVWTCVGCINLKPFLFSRIGRPNQCWIRPATTMKRAVGVKSIHPFGRRIAQEEEDPTGDENNERNPSALPSSKSTLCKVGSHFFP